MANTKPVGEDEKIKELTEQKDNVYHERNMLVAALSKVYESYLGRHEESDTTWENDWRNIVYIYIPQMITRNQVQLSWHIHDSELELFKHLKYDHDIKWDGHTTEEKYMRLKFLPNRS